MNFNSNTSFVNYDMVKKGLMRVVPYMVRIDRFFTEDQKRENIAYANAHNAEEWNIHCEEIRKSIAEVVHSFMEELKEVVKIGQYEKDYPDDFSLWFWCNTIESGRDYSTVTLTFADDEKYKENEKVLCRILEVIQNFPSNSIRAVIQYESIPIKENIEAAAERFYNDNIGKYVVYGGTCIGKLFKSETVGYYLKKKNAKTKAYYMSALDVCKCEVYKA